MVEPAHVVHPGGPARLIEASDDLGQSLVPEPADLATTLSDSAHFAFYGGSGVARVRTEFHLRLTDRPGRVARLRGVVPVMLHLRRPEPTLIIPLAGAAGKTLRCDDAEFTIKTVSDSATTTNVSMTVRLNVDKADLPANADGELIVSRLRRDGQHHQLRLTDAFGTVMSYSTSSGSGSGDTPSVYEFDHGHQSEWPRDSPALLQHAARPVRGGVRLPGRALALRQSWHHPRLEKESTRNRERCE